MSSKSKPSSSLAAAVSATASVVPRSSQSSDSWGALAATAAATRSTAGSAAGKSSGKLTGKSIGKLTGKLTGQGTGKRMTGAGAPARKASAACTMVALMWPRIARASMAAIQSAR